MIDFYNPTHIYFTSYENIGILIRKYGFSKVVLLCGSSYLKSSGILDNILKKLKEEGKLSKKEEVKVRREKIKDLLAEGLSQKEIYSLLKISKRTCVNDVKFLKEQGLI